jgi:rubrerythrin
MSDKPSYLGLLNAVALAESSAHCYLSEWAAVTKDPDVRQVLLTVAAREGEHAMSFAKRINELGYELRQKPDEGLDKKLDIARSDCSDLEKMEALGLPGLDSQDRPDIFDDFFKDHSIDIRTGELLGRYIAEERDTGRLLRGCYECVREAAETEAATNGAGKPDRATRATTKRIAALEVKVDALCDSIDDLTKVIRAKAVSTN